MHFCIYLLCHFARMICALFNVAEGSGVVSILKVHKIKQRHHPVLRRVQTPKLSEGSHSATTAFSSQLLGKWSDKRNTMRGYHICHPIRQKCKGTSRETNFSLAPNSRGIYKLGYRALGNIKDNAFPRTCLKDTETETSFQGPRLIRPLKKAKGSREALQFFTMSAL